MITEEKLMLVVKKHNNLYAEVGIEHLILMAYRLEKPLTGIEIYGQEPKNVEEFVNEISPFFFVISKPWEEMSTEHEYNGEVYVSRFKTLIDVVRCIDLTDHVADLAGIFYGYDLKDIVKYCKRREHCGLVKGLIKYYGVEERRGGDKRG